MLQELWTLNTASVLSLDSRFSACIEHVAHVYVLDSTPVQLVPCRICPRCTDAKQLRFRLVDSIGLAVVNAADTDLCILSMPKTTPDDYVHTPSRLFV